MSPRVKRIIVSHGLTGFICWYGIEKIFQKNIGISVLQVSLLAITYISVSALFNVPTGILADKYGRKYAIALAAVALFLSTISGGLSYNAWQYLVPIILWGIFYTTQNGAYESILYDTLKEEGNERQYARVSGVMNAAFWIAIFVSSVIGAWIGNRYSLRLVYFITAIPNLFNILLALSLQEPKRKKHDTSVKSYAMAKQGVTFLISTPHILKLAGTFLMISLFSWTTNEFGQLYFIELGFAVLAVGLLNAFSGLFQSAGNFMGHRFNHVSSRFMTILLFTVFVITFLIPVKFRAIGTALFLVFVLIRQVFYISNDTELQHTLPSEIRATTISALGMVNDGVLVVSYLSFGFVSQRYGIRRGYLLVGCFALVILLVSRLLARKKLSTEASASTSSFVPIVEVDSMPR